jgi:TetR/AcrR family transcriptional regulator, transcriptional repressor of aconitase
MPKVSEEHLERRRQQILDAARACFVRKGFHETSMQDVFRESGLSAGAVYRYFKSKDDIVRAIAGQKVEQFATLLSSILRENPPLGLDEVMDRVARFAGDHLDQDGALRLAPQAWALALYNPEIGTAIEEIFRMNREWFTKVVERMKEAGRLAPDADPEAVGATLMCIAPGYVLQRLIVGDIDAETLRKGVHGIMGGT